MHAHLSSGAMAKVTMSEPALRARTAMREGGSPSAVARSCANAVLKAATAAWSDTCHNDNTGAFA